MKLNALAATTGASTATIKYWIREQIVPPGTLRNQTTAVYDTEHVYRIRLIRTLRERFDQPIADIRRLTEMLDDETVPIVTIMDACQHIAAGLGAVGTDTVPGAGTETDASQHQDTVSELLSLTGWPDVTSTARTALADTLREVEEHGTPYSAGRLATYATALAGIAEEDLAYVGDNSDDNDDDNVAEPHRDEIARRVLVGTRAQTRVLLAMNNLAHASTAIRRGMES